MLGALTIGGNLIGGLLAFLYFSYINVPGDTLSKQGATLHHIIFAVIAGGIIFSTTSFVSTRWSRPLIQALKGEIPMDGTGEISGKELKRKALHFVPMMAGISILGWIMAGFLFGMVMPVIMQALFGFAPYTLQQSLGMIFGITCIGGSITSLAIYFFGESLWRRDLPRFFPEGDLSAVRGAFKVNVKARLLIVSLMISLLPLTVLGVSAYCRAQALLSADAPMGEEIISGLLLQIIFITAVGVSFSLILSLFVSKSVSAPLKEMERAMKEVEKGNLDVRINVVSNDEIGALGEGFTRMIRGLKESEAIKESFGKYISQEIRDEILAGRVPLDGEMKRVTLLFSDLRDFTPFVESTHPKKVVSIMNQYFSEMAEAINENHGLILQYVGDEIEAVFGAPVSYDDHPDMAARAAIEMQKRLHLLNQRLNEQGLAPLRHGIGIHTGAVLAGIIGSKDRSSYALVGDTVNLASRIQGLTKHFSCDTILSQTTHDLMTGAYQMEPLSPTKVKGKSQEVMLYKLLGSNHPLGGLHSDNLRPGME
jgi:adenylate cyclase